MYVPAKFKRSEEAAWEIVRDAGAGLLVIAGADGLASVLAPIVISDDRCTLTSHVARANPWWTLVQPTSEVLALFLAASAYVSPTNYPSRLEDPGVVPTWNYEMVEVRGQVIVHDDPQWTGAQVRRATENFERDRDPQWHVDDAPADFVAKQLRAIVGIEIAVRSIEGKSKLSQNRPAIDHDAVRDALATGTFAQRNVAQRMSGDE